MLAALLLLACAPAALAQAAPSARDTARSDTVRADTVRPVTAPADSARDPLRAFVYDLADPVAGLSALALGLYDHARTEPEEWGGGADALGWRIASRAGGHVVGTSVRHGVAYWLGRSTEEEPCGCTRAYDRVSHAVLETFTDRNLATGDRVLSEPFFAGTYSGALAPLLWHPDATFYDALRSGTLSIVLNVAGQVVFALVDPGR